MWPCPIDDIYNNNNNNNNNLFITIPDLEILNQAKSLVVKSLTMGL